MDCLGLAQQWEKQEEIRTRLRDHGSLLQYPETDTYCKPSRGNSTGNAVVLRPVLERIRHAKLKLPHIEALKLEVRTLYKKCGVTSAGEKTIYATTMGVKQFAGFVKRRLAQGEVTKDHLVVKKQNPNISKQHMCLALHIIGNHLLEIYVIEYHHFFTAICWTSYYVDKFCVMPCNVLPYIPLVGQEIP